MLLLLLLLLSRRLQEVVADASFIFLLSIARTHVVCFKQRHMMAADVQWQSALVALPSHCRVSISLLLPVLRSMQC